MSIQPPNDRGQWGRPNSAWGRPAADWRAPEAPAAVPAAPREELPAPPTRTQRLGDRRHAPSVTIEQFQPRRNRTGPLLLVVVALAVVAAILYFGLRPETLGASDGSDSSPTPTSAPTMPSLPTGGAFADSINFASDRVSGVFAINESNWEGSTLVVDVTIAVEWGSLSYDFLAMDMASGDVIPSNLPADPSDLSDGTLNAGEQVSGTVRFTKERGDTQVLLGDAGRSNLTMLAVKGP